MLEAVTNAIETTRFDAILVAANWHPRELNLLQDTVKFLKPFTNTTVLFGPIVQYRTNLPDILLNSKHPDRM